MSSFSHQGKERKGKVSPSNIDNNHRGIMRAAAAFSRVLPARCRRAYHNDVTLVRVAERFDISQPPDWYRLNRAAVVKEFPHDKEV